MPKPTAHIIDWFDIAMKIKPMQLADYMVRSQAEGVGAALKIDHDTER
ncbi:hypothetical protein [Mesorhizobium silamurunense]|nr:hypothetical protein [Mesorhizobium silamurunense]